jgi:hypothetical protein
MKSTSESERDKRLAVATFLRDSDGLNKERLQHINQILNGQPYQETEISHEKTQLQTAQQEEKAFWRSFRIRCAVALLLTIGLFLAAMTDSPQITPYMKKIKTAVEADYSENLFDFIEQIPYTLEYEKINA